MPRALTTQIIGKEDAIKNVRKFGRGVEKSLREAVARAATRITTGAKRRVVVDTGRLRASISATYFQGGLTAEVGTDAFYAPFIEFGTGPLGASTNRQQLPSGYAHGGPFFPPPGALKNWARRHKIESPFLVARAIAEKGGAEARPFLFPSWEAERPRFLREIPSEVKKEARKHAK
jgi:HK97 gp10 family phage protein